MKSWVETLRRQAWLTNFLDLYPLDQNEIISFNFKYSNLIGYLFFPKKPFLTLWRGSATGIHLHIQSLTVIKNERNWISHVCFRSLTMQWRNRDRFNFSSIACFLGFPGLRCWKSMGSDSFDISVYILNQWLAYLDLNYSDNLSMWFSELQLNLPALNLSRFFSHALFAQYGAETPAWWFDPSLAYIPLSNSTSTLIKN